MGPPQSELLKDILSFANTDGTSYILIGVAEVNGVATDVVGVNEHLPDADIHQFVNSKTNRRIEFQYFPCEVCGKKIGVIVIPAQKNRPYFVQNNYGSVKKCVVWFRDGSGNAEASQDDIYAMMRERLPQWLIDPLHSLAGGAVISVAQQWREHPHRACEFTGPHQSMSYEAAREFALSRSHTIDDYQDELDSYGSLDWVFKLFKEVAVQCNNVSELARPVLAAYQSLTQAIERLEVCIHAEEEIWDEFLKSAGHPNSPLPREASYNLLVMAELSVRLIDVLDSENLAGDREYEERIAIIGSPLVWRSIGWGEWR